MKDAIRQRVIEVIKERHTTVNAVAKELDMVQTTLNRQINGKNPIGLDIVLGVHALYPEYSLNWLVDGTLPKYAELKEDNREEVAEHVRESVQAYTELSDKFSNLEKQYGTLTKNPLFSNITVACGMERGGDLAAMEGQEEGYISFPQSIFPTMNGDLYVVANGRSMIDHKHPERSIDDGSIVCLRKQNIKGFRWGEIYALSTIDGFLIKKILQGSDEDHILCVSANEEEKFQPFEIPLEFVKDSRIVAGVLNVKIFI